MVVVDYRKNEINTRMSMPHRPEARKMLLR